MNLWSKHVVPVVFGTLATLGWSISAQAGAHGGMNIPMIKATTLMEGLDNPWDMAFLPDGTMFYTEKCKGLSVRMPNGSVNPLYGMKGSTGYASSGDDLFCEGQAGMLSVAVDRDFAKNQHLYVYSSSTKYHGAGCKTNFE